MINKQERTIIVDNSIACFGYHIENGIPIRPWYNDWNDRELYNLATCVRAMAVVDDVRPMLYSLFHLQDTIDSIIFSQSVFKKYKDQITKNHQQQCV